MGSGQKLQLYSGCDLQRKWIGWGTGKHTDAADSGAVMPINFYFTVNRRCGGESQRRWRMSHLGILPASDTLTHWQGGIQGELVEGNGFFSR